MGTRVGLAPGISVRLTNAVDRSIDARQEAPKITKNACPAGLNGQIIRLFYVNTLTKSTVYTCALGSKIDSGSISPESLRNKGDNRVLSAYML